jgi:hypothetical protein
VPIRRWWTTDEVRLLIDLYRRTGRRPSDAALESLRHELLEMADPEFRRDPSYRSVDSIREQLSWVDVLARDDPRAREAPRAFRDAWDVYGYIARPLRDQDVDQTGAATDRQALIRALEDLREALAELVQSPTYLPTDLRESYSAAWFDIENRGHIDQAILSLRGPAVDDLLAAHGLVGAQLAAKTESVANAARERRRRPGWRPLKALLGYLDSILGSLTDVLPWLGVVKEFKEITEASAELSHASVDVGGEE